MRSVRTRRWFRPEGEPSLQHALQNEEQHPGSSSGSGSGFRHGVLRKICPLLLALAVIFIQPGCHGALGDWLTRSSLVPGGVPPQTEPDIDFKMSEPEMTADADDS